MMKRRLILLAAGMICLAPACSKTAPARPGRLPTPPLNMEALKDALSYVRGETKGEPTWPRTIHYTYRTYDFRTDTFHQEERAFEEKQRPTRIVPHAVGVTEILWAICPRERLIAFNKLATDPKFCFLADAIRKQGRIFQTKQTELIIGYRPDLVFTVFYSSQEFKEKLKQAGIPYLDLGYFGTMNTIKEQIRLIGRVIGEEGNAEALVKLIDEKIRELHSKLPEKRSGVRALYYDEGGYVPGRSSNFESICEIVGAVNVGTEQGVKSWSQIDYETLLKWNPEMILVPEGSGLDEQLRSNPIMAHARAVKEKRIYSVPGIYLRVDSQFLLLSANLLAGIVYEGGS